MSKQRIGRYEVIRTLPGDPPSFLAHAPGTGTSLVRRVGPVPSDAVERVVREVGVCSALGHPAIGAAEAFADGEHLAFAVPEREGIPLEGLIERLAATGEPLAEPAVWHIARELAAALSAAHSAALDDDLVTVCHGFLAPSWVWLSWDGAVGLDALGLAAVADVPGLRAPSNYDAPERRRGGKPNSRGDIYSLGAIVLALLTGEEPVEEPSLASLPQSVPEAVRMVVERAIEPALAKRKLTAAEFEMAFAELAGVDGRKALATALVRLRKGTNVLGTFQRPVALPPRVGAAGPTPSPSTPPSGIPLPRPAGAPLGTMLGAGPPRPAIPRPGGPLPTPSSSPPGSAPLGVRPPPARTMLGIAVPKPPAPTSPEPSSPPAASSQPEVPAPPQAEPAVAAPAPTSRPSVALDDEPPPPSIRPRLPSISQGRRVTKSSFAIEDELSWGGGKTDDIARAVDAALLDDIVAPTGASPSEPSAPTSSRAPEPPPPPPPPPITTKPSPTSDPPPPSADSVRFDRADSDSLRAGGAPREEPRSEPGGAGLPPSVGAPKAAGAPTFAVVKDEPRPLALWKAALLALGAAGVVFAGGVWWMMRQQHLPPPTVSPDEVASAVPSASASSTAETASASATVEATASASAAPTVEPSASASADASAAPTASASAEASASAAPSVVPTVDPASLQPNQAVLVVHFAGPSDATVFHFATPLGKVEQPLTVACDKPLFLRVADKVDSGAPGKWLSAGNPRSMTCRKLNEVTIAPTP
jgi:serine/threonine protein kinase